MVYAYTHAYVHTHARTHARTYIICIYIYACIGVYVYRCVCTCIHVYNIRDKIEQRFIILSFSKVYADELSVGL
jgi:hypothetical protein